MPVDVPRAVFRDRPSPASAGEPELPAAGLVAGRWTLRLLGGLEASNGDVLLTHFVSQPIAALLALLAMGPERSHPREALIERLWPGVALEVGRNRLRNAISTLRRLLEPPGVPSGSVIVADRQNVRLAPNASTCDALEFEQAVRTGQFAKARALYRGELLPGFYDDWVQDERARLGALFDRVSETGPEPAAAPAMPREAAAELSDRARTKPMLPSYLTSYFGREDERRRLRVLVGEQRLVTLSGVGGCGKTRLAVEVAHALLAAPGGFDSAVFVTLADCRDAAQVGAQLRVALQIVKTAADPIDEAVAALRDRARPLLVLDNFEQLVAAGGVPIVEALLARVPALHLLVTSRRALGVAGEREFVLQPLPPPEAQGTVEEVAANASVSMFVDRARSVRPDFQVTPRNHESIAALCRALEGLPLAIELAASRSRAFSPSDMHAALAQRFSLLARGAARSGQAGARHDSLRGAIDWSWRLLQPHQQRFLLALSVFRGGWSAHGAQEVSEVADAHTLLEQLTADSLLRSEVDASGAMRFFMLETIREYLQEQLAPAEARRLRQRHRAHFLAQALALGQRVQAAPRDELPNFVEALQSAVDDGESGLALALGVALRGEWAQHGTPPAVRALLERALALAQAGEVPRGLLAQTHLLLRRALALAGESDAGQAHVERALSIAGTQPALRAEALVVQASHWAARLSDVAPIRSILDEALRLAQQERATETEAGALVVMSTLRLRDDGQPAEALALLRRAQGLFEAAGIDHAANHAMFMQGNCLAELHRYEEALTLLAECERRIVAGGHLILLPQLANVQGLLYACMRRWRDAELAYARCALGAARQQNRYTAALGLWNLGRPLAHTRRPEAGGLLMAFTARYWVPNFGPLTPSDLRDMKLVRRLIRVQVGAAELERIWQRGEALTLPAALDIAAESMRP